MTRATTSVGGDRAVSLSPAAIESPGGYFRAALYVLIAFACILAGIIARAVWLCDGHFGYPMDDTYIHMAMAKSFALHGVWGVTQYGFTSSTSSPLFTLLVAACYRLTGVREVTPLAINIVLSVAVIGWCAFALRSARLSVSRTGWAMLALMLSIPLPILAISGMEHILQVLLVLIFAHEVCRSLAEESAGARDYAVISVLSALLVATRYEGAFLAFAAGCLLAARRMWGVAATVGVGSIAPIVVYGEIAKQQGWPFFPTSLLLKANLPDGSNLGTVRAFLWGLGNNCVRAPHIVFLFVAAAFLLWVSIRKYRTIWRAEQCALILFLATTAFHMSLARVGWYFRYEAYLVAFGLMACLLCLERVGLSAVWESWRVPTTALTLCLLGAIAFRTVRAVYLTPTGIRNIYDQQYQMGLFLHEYFPRAAVVVNDIGAVSFLSDVRLLDVQGLGSVGAAEARFHGQYSPEWLRDRAVRDHAQLAIIYPHIGPPPDWIHQATWTIPDNWIAGRPSVGIYAIDPAVTPLLQSSLREFRSKLPRGVRQAGL